MLSFCACLPQERRGSLDDLERWWRKTHGNAPGLQAEIARLNATASALMAEYNARADWLREAELLRSVLAAVDEDDGEGRRDLSVSDLSRFSGRRLSSSSNYSFIGGYSAKPTNLKTTAPNGHAEGSGGTIQNVPSCTEARRRTRRRENSLHW